MFTTQIMNKAGVSEQSYTSCNYKQNYLTKITLLNLLLLPNVALKQQSGCNFSVLLLSMNIAVILAILFGIFLMRAEPSQPLRCPYPGKYVMAMGFSESQSYIVAQLYSLVFACVWVSNTV